MDYLADLHLHSKYSRAVSQSMTLPLMAEYARQKGLDILTASDFTHTLWFKEIQALLEESGEGVYKLKGGAKDKREVLFLLSTEISSIYKQGDKLRRIHNLVFVPNLETAEKVNKELLKRGCNLSADGRPIIGLSARNLLELILSIDKNCLLIPCHVWTPHFGVYGSKSGFDSLTEAFGDLAKYVYGIETGISSDPEMNWRINELTNRSILSFSDAHSPRNMAREATAFKLDEPSYANIRKAIMRIDGDSNKVSYTIEFYPEEGKYHFSGHRNCKVSLTPKELEEKGKICPVCKRELTEGVAPRIEQLAGADFAKCYQEKVSKSGVKWYTDKTGNHPPYVKLVRLEQVIAAGLGVTTASQRVPEMYDKLYRELGAEIDILLKADVKDIERVADKQIAKTVSKVRSGDIVVDPGFDGEYGKVKIWSEEEKLAKALDLKKDTPQLSFDI